MDINIIPVGGFPKPGTQLRVDNTLVSLTDNTANCQWAILDEDGNITSGPGRSDITSAQMDAWIGDNGYIVKCVAANLGLTPA
jgi:hypothetical protein